MIIATILATASVPLLLTCLVLWNCYLYMYDKWKEECRSHRATVRERRGLEDQQADGLMLPQQTRIFGNAKTEVLIAEWLEGQYEPFGNDLTDFENSQQIAARIRRGEYLNELVSSED